MRYSGRTMAETGVLIVLCTFPERSQARQIGTALIEAQLAACVNLLPQVESIYLWKGKICHEDEILAVFKVPETGFRAFEAELVTLHPYETPEVLALPVTAGSQEYLAWVLGK
jgi:periplasmic divalent cation tolerance protein